MSNQTACSMNLHPLPISSIFVLLLAFVDTLSYAAHSISFRNFGVFP